MKRFMKVLLGLSIGAAVAVLFAPKSGRELRQQLIGGATGKLLPAAPVEFPEPAGERLRDTGPATAVAEPVVEEPAHQEPQIVEDAIVAEAVVAEVAAVDEPATLAEAAVVVAEAAVEEVAAVEPEVVEEVAAAEPEVAAEELRSDDLRARIEETRAAVEADIAEPFAPIVVQAAVEEAAVEEPAVGELPAVEPVVQEPVVEEPVLEGPELREPSAPPEPEVVVEAPAEAVAEVAEVREVEAIAAVVVEEAPLEEPVVPVAEEPVPVEPVAAPPAAEPAVEEEPSAREGGTINQAEMRRRIEETRARLKAKAFDAMMSGESALLARDSGEKPVPKGDDVKLDVELESTIDESLSQEEY